MTARNATLRAALLAFAMMLTGCAGSLGKISSDDPTERGCSYIAAAIVTSAILRALFNK